MTATAATEAEDAEGGHLWEGLDEEDLKEDAEDAVMMPEDMLTRDQSVQSLLQLHQARSLQELAERLKITDVHGHQYRGDPVTEDETTAGYQVPEEERKTVDMEQHDKDVLALKELQYQATKDETSVTTTTWPACYDRGVNEAPLISIEGVPQRCMHLKAFCEGAGDKSIYVSQKCPMTCMNCVRDWKYEPTGLPRETNCFRRRRHGFCYTRRRRYGDPGGDLFSKDQYANYLVTGRTAEDEFVEGAEEVARQAFPADQK